MWKKEHKWMTTYCPTRGPLVFNTNDSPKATALENDRNTPYE